MENGFVPIERIIIKEYKTNKDLFVVVEGNRRVAALKSLIRDNQDGVINLDSDQVRQFSTIPCVILEANKMEEAERTIMGIRHIAGTKGWGAYQQAQLIHELIDEQGLESEEVAERLGMSKVETNRRYRAMSALKQMEQDEEYGDHANKDQYRLFHELVSQPVVREKFGWDHGTSKFVDTDSARQFFELIAPHTDGSQPKLLTYGDVRRLRKIVENDNAFEILIDPDREFREAISEVEISDRQKRGGGTLSIDSFLQYLSGITITELKDFDSTQIENLEQISSLSSELAESKRKLDNE